MKGFFLLVLSVVCLQSGQAMAQLSGGPNAVLPAVFFPSASVSNTLLNVNVSQNCLQNSMDYINSITTFLTNASQTPEWALKMIDASAKFPTGILEGNVKWLGSFTECLRIQNDGLFSGQYCTANLYSNSSSFNLAGLHFDLQSPSALSKLLSCNCVTVGICWPSTCNQSEIQNFINYFELPLKIQDGSCHVETPTSFDATTVAVIVLFCLFGVILVLGTALDVLPRLRNPNPAVEMLKPGILKRVLLSFSIYKNGKRILNTKTNDDSLGCIHGIRLLSMFWVILGHTYDYANTMPIKNTVDVVSSLHNAAFDVILNGTYSVDTFLFISGFLITFLGLKQLKKSGGHLNIFLYYFHRYWRLTPVYAMIIALIAGPYYMMGSGPQWQFMQSAQQNCRTYWWRNLLYINNLYDTSHMCIDVSWYISMDMQYYLIMPLVLIPLYRTPFLGFLMIAILFVITTLTPALYIHYHDIPGYPGPQILFDGSSAKALDYQANVYVKSYCRMGPYLVGVCLAYFLFKKELRVKINWWVNVLGWMLAACLALTLIYGTYDYFDGDKVMSNSLNTVYGAFSRTAWGLCIAWLVFACVTGNGGFVNTLLSWKGMVPLSRLTYCGYLLHLYILLLLFGTQEVVYYFQQYLLVIIYCGFLVVVMGISFIFSLAFEAPMMELEKIILPKSEQDKLKRGLNQQMDSRQQRISEQMEEIGATVCRALEKVSGYENEAYLVSEDDGVRRQ